MNPWHRKGPEHPAAKLTAVLRRRLVAEYRAGRPVRELARAYLVSERTVYRRIEEVRREEA